MLLLWRLRRQSAHATATRPRPRRRELFWGVLRTPHSADAGFWSMNRSIYASDVAIEYRTCRTLVRSGVQETEGRCSTTVSFGSVQIERVSCSMNLHTDCWGNTLMPVEPRKRCHVHCGLPPEQYAGQVTNRQRQYTPCPPLSTLPCGSSPRLFGRLGRFSRGHNDLVHHKAREKNIKKTAWIITPSRKVVNLEQNSVL